MYLVSDLLFNEAVAGVYVCHDIYNTSDHDPVQLKLQIEFSCRNVEEHAFIPRFAWHKAKPNDRVAYTDLLKLGCHISPNQCFSLP